MQQDYGDRNAVGRGVVLVAELEVFVLPLPLRGAAAFAAFVLRIFFVFALGTKAQTLAAGWRGGQAHALRDAEDAAQKEQDETQVKDGTPPALLAQEEQEDQKRRDAADAEKDQSRIVAARDEGIGDLEGAVDGAVAVRDQELRETECDDGRLEGHQKRQTERESAQQQRRKESAAAKAQGIAQLHEGVRAQAMGEGVAGHQRRA